MRTWGTLHAGDVVQGPDGAHWTVVLVLRVDGLELTLRRGDAEATSRPDPDGLVTVVERSDTSAEYAAHSALSAVFGGIDVLGEKWS